MSTFSMLVLVVRQARHVGRSVAQPPRACVCFARPPRLPGPHHTRDEQWQPGADAKLRGVPSAMPSATRSRQADRKPNFQAVLPVSCPTASLPLACKSHCPISPPRTAPAAPPPPPPPQTVEIANHTVCSTPKNPCNAGCRMPSHPGQLHEGRLDRARPNEISYLRTIGVTAVQRQLFVLPG